MLKQNLILSLFQDESVIHNFFNQDRSQNKNFQIKTELRDIILNLQKERESQQLNVGISVEQKINQNLIVNNNGSKSNSYKLEIVRQYNQIILQSLSKSLILEQDLNHNSKIKN
ncbi:unnamed protein product [Paramecium primaurelia]|uniref:Uncharacterized protein n=1 Tax=Paramecium primaurelia TaxID=5886 RepID=A0A8S1N1D6_PARPR|nr:unnamed protein product [Paramecium primaurelia]